MTVHTDDQATLLLGNGFFWCAGSTQYLSLIQQFVDIGVFKDIITYDNSIGHNGSTVEDTEQTIVEKLDDYFAKKNVVLISFDKIYSATDGEDALGIYFSLKQINYWRFEATPNMLNFRTSDWVMETYKNKPGYRDAIIKNGALIGKSIYESSLLHPASDLSLFSKENDLIIVTDVWEKMTSDQLLRSNHIVIEIAKVPIKDKNDIIAPMDTEYIYVFSEDKYILDSLIDWSLTKENIYSGVIIKAISMLSSNVLKANNDTLKANNNAFKTENEVFKANNDTLKMENDILKKGIDGFLNSKSWKITKPFRVIAGFVRRIL